MTHDHTRFKRHYRKLPPPFYPANRLTGSQQPLSEKILCYFNLDKQI